MRNAMYRVAVFAMVVSIVVMLFSPATSFSADPIYKWVDEKGVTQYSQKPPSQRNTQEIKPQSKPSRNSADGENATTKSLRDQESAFQQRHQKRKQDEQQAEDKAKALEVEKKQKTMAEAEARQQRQRLADCVSRKVRRDIEAEKLASLNRQGKLKGVYVVPPEVHCD